MRRMIQTAAAVMFALSIALPTVADSLWTDTSDSLFGDKKALYVGDLVTIIVNQRTQAKQESNTEVTQEEKMESGTGDGILGKIFEKFGIEATDEYAAEGETTSGSTLSTTIAAEVVEVLPNGNLLIEARRSMVVNEETQTMIISGVIRPEDVGRNNRIDSMDIANLNIRYQGKGPISKRQKTGVLNKIFNFIF